jgi:SulP family sulfate permease
MIALLEARAAGLYTRAHLGNNLLAGVVVGIVALPLAMAFAIASGARPEQGLYTAIVAGLITALFGGTRVQISGPTGAFVAVLSIITAQHGIGGLQVATLMAGVILLVFGLARFGAVIKYIPEPVIVGFTAGIGVIIFVGQWQGFFGLEPAPTGPHFLQKFVAMVRVLPQLHLATTALGFFTLTILIVGPRLVKAVPAPLLGMLAATALQASFHFPGVATIGSAFGGIPRALPPFAVPSVDFAQLLSLVGPAFTIALLGAIESLLSAVVADGMVGTRHDSNQELIGQGLANIVAPLFGGFAATGAIARTATNIRNGATSPLAGVVHSLFLVLVIVVLAPMAAAIPLCALAAILFVVAWNMSELPHFLRLARGAPRADVANMLLTFGLTVFVDLVVAVNVGVMLAALLFVRRMAESVNVEIDSGGASVGLDAETERAAGAPPVRAAQRSDVVVYLIDGPFFFGAAEKLEGTLAHIQQRARVLILRMGRVPFVDATGIFALEEMVHGFQRHGVTVLLCELRANVRVKLERAGVIESVGAGQVFDTLEQARAAAEAVPQNR